MKKVISISLIAASLMFGAVDKKPINDGPYVPQINTCKIENNNNINNSIDLSIKTTNIEESDLIESTLLSMPIMWNIVSDALKQYNNTEDIKPYLTSKNLKDFTSTIIYSKLIALKFSIFSLKEKYSNDSEQMKVLENEYKRLINTIKPSNPNWCNETINLEIKNFLDSELQSKIAAEKDEAK